MNEEATKPVLEFVNAFGCGGRLALRNPSRYLIDSLFFQFLPMARRVPGYRQNTFVSQTCLSNNLEIFLLVIMCYEDELTPGSWNATCHSIRAR